MFYNHSSTLFHIDAVSSADRGLCLPSLHFLGGADPTVAQIGLPPKCYRRTLSSNNEEDSLSTARVADKYAIKYIITISAFFLEQ